MVVLDDDDSRPNNFDQEPGDDNAEDGVFSDAEIHFVGRTVLDNGLEVGARVELEGEDDSGEDGDQIDEAWIWFSGGFGEIRIGSDDEALANSCVLPPGGTANFSAFSPNQWGANSLNSFPFGAVSNSACTGVDDKGDAQKIIYFSPLFYGFQLSASYTPNPGCENTCDGVGAHLGMPAKDASARTDPMPTATRRSISPTRYQGDDWGLTWGGGASWEMGTDDSTEFTDFEDQDFYQTGAERRISAGSRSAACSSISTTSTASNSHRLRRRHDLNAWVAGGGIAYAYRCLDLRRAILLPPGHLAHHFLRLRHQDRAGAAARGGDRQLCARPRHQSRWRGRLYLARPRSRRRRPFETDDDYDGLEFGIGTAVSFYKGSRFLLPNRYPLRH